MDKAFEVTERLNDLNEYRKDLLRELNESLALQMAVPDAFDHGKATVRWNVGKPMTAHSSLLLKWPQDYSVTITKGNGEEVTLHLKDHLDSEWIDKLRKPVLKTKE